MPNKIEEKIEEFEEKFIYIDISKAPCTAQTGDEMVAWLRSALTTLTQEAKEEVGKRCLQCSTHRKTANNGERYLCNHFSEYCPDCEEWVTQNPKEK